MILLAIETAYDICGAAILNGETLLALEEVTAPRQHNERLAYQAEQAMQAAGLGFKQLDAIAVSSGPGSYTGLRIGMSYAKGLATGLALPIISVPTLSAMAHGVQEQIDWIAAWSHRDLFYCAEVHSDTLGELHSFSSAELKAAATGKKLACHLGQWEGALFGAGLIPVCPSVENVGKFALVNELTPRSDIEGLEPEYFHNYQLN
ncbi:MAG: tRNA (adenosine(37)-N6)-threonylcarbamoyltransferase complex dimerization subunit type 1 TsaB [Candidatus Marinimicrobia bacterium]|nr:tRNA (adenosine(37)-N6)-threonylcarbamoyltransferase complex dimerization subunit type 1 TsaB [Candidatus Neomarinimicrobiota bacterium]